MKNIRARINDDDLAKQIDEAAEEHGSISEAVRHAIGQTYGDSDDSDDSEDEPRTAADTVSDSSLRNALRCLWSISRGRDGGRDNVGHTSADAAMSVLAQEFSVNKAAVKPMYLTPLKAADVIDVDPGADQTIIYVVDPDAPVPDDRDPVETTNDPTDDTEEEIDDQLAEIDAAEPVRATDRGRDQ